MNVPWLSRKHIGDTAAIVLEDYETLCGQPAAPPIPVDRIIEQYLDVDIGFVDFQKTCRNDNILGATYVDKNLICANIQFLEDHASGRLYFTLAHEAGHWVLHRHLALPDGHAREAAGARARPILCRAGDGRKRIEWQADYFAACLLMPEKNVAAAWERVFGPEPMIMQRVQTSWAWPFAVEPCVANWPLVAAEISRVGGFTNVSKLAMAIRLQELGFIRNETDVPIGWYRARADADNSADPLTV